MQIAQRLYEGVDLGRRDGRADHLYAHRRRRDLGRGDRRRARADRRRFRREIRARRAARLPQPGEERAGGARGDPPDRSGAQARRCRGLSRPRPAPALRADLEADPGEPDGVGPARAGHRRHRRSERQAAAARDRLGRAVRRISARSIRRTATTARRRGGRRRAGCRRCARARAWRAARSCRASISPSRRRATPRRASSKSSKSSASAGPRPMPRSSRCCRTAPMSGSKSGAFCRRTAAASSPPF